MDKKIKLVVVLYFKRPSDLYYLRIVFCLISYSSVYYEIKFITIDNLLCKCVIKIIKLCIRLNYFVLKPTFFWFSRTKWYKPIIFMCDVIVVSIVLFLHTVTRYTRKFQCFIIL